MKWWHRVSKNYQWLLKLQGRGLNVPALNEQPELFQEAFAYVKAYNELSISKPLSFIGAGPVPYSEICKWLDEHKITDFEKRLAFLIFVPFIDAELSALERANDDTGSGKHKSPEDKDRPPRRQLGA